MKTAITALAIVAGTTASAQTLNAVSSGSNNFLSESVTAGALVYNGNAYLGDGDFGNGDWDPGDMFGRTTGGVTAGGAAAGLPFAMQDDSAGSFPTDGVGIISEFDTTTEFFGVVDTANNVNGSGFGTADYTWADTGANTFVDSFSVDVAAIGDFEGSDQYRWDISTDGGSTFTNIASAAANEDISFQYTMDSGALSTLNDPMVLDGTILTNDFATFTFDNLNLAVTGDIVLRFVGASDGGSEAFAWNNASIEVVPAPASAALLGLGGLAAARRRR
ncbi:MAG: PEP-CTERM sorting domain-containing protein [Planctomycetota bacterium]